MYAIVRVERHLLKHCLPFASLLVARLTHVVCLTRVCAHFAAHGHLDTLLWMLIASLQLGVGGLVAQLREPDVNGAPLLFQAATNSGTIGCFKPVHKVRLKLRIAREPHFL